MILVLNLNASLDKRYEVTDMVKGKVIRAKQVQNTPGGKGIHVANVITILNEECIATGLLGGKAGEFINEKLNEYKIKHDFVNINGETRSCLAIISDDLVQTEILEPGPEVSKNEQQYFLDKYIDLVKDVDIVVASGSVPRNIPSNFYRKLIEMTNSQGKRFLLDTSGELLKEGIKGKPYFIKPNRDEIEALTGRKIDTIEDAVEEIKRFQSQGVEFVVISLGVDGSVAGTNGKFYKVNIPKVKAINPVGSGDSYVAGVAISIQRGYTIEETLKFASACGTANAMEKESGFVTKFVVDELTTKIRVEEIQ
ncbi:MAG: 1-phosphofructokinase [Clostridium sp.]|uniref:1-phosphofructokinase n=1 Tax=Clostridium sp. TaxID=1506 RepID=UPI0025C0BF77|nr:1-phosphofructokinase [Clostridium sp.]MCH3965955.1 1-phosphofructokinase [Clostridium sp.]MCI1715956.1 1-phosphofructokinase [Clostridium sp.]MCI1800372.1 1-phosphofructokinase [Clostridium sp.]MCI1814133.1 1-phosphofructokinase [Clostridium sp.]MCI1871032.1 1-phosphofructokinase [Clostridium sp.]